LLLSYRYIIFGVYIFTMEAYIKYKRFVKQFREDDIDNFFEELIKGGWEIIHYQEKACSVDAIGTTIDIIIVAGKKANQIKNIL
jgi:hypothetical protein